jgi:heme A synthase
MSRVHLYVAYVVPAGFAVLAIWALISFLRNRTPASGFWTLLGFLQVVLGLQVIVGGILFLSGLQPTTEGPVWLHYAYGGLFPAALLVGAHRFGTKHQDVAWIVFGVVAFLNAGLTVRALMTGLGG